MDVCLALSGHELVLSLRSLIATLSHADLLLYGRSYASLNMLSAEIFKTVADVASDTKSQT